VRAKLYVPTVARQIIAEDFDAQLEKRELNKEKRKKRPKEKA
jgi:hypothetical protein